MLKFKTAHLLMLAHGRASEMLMAQHLLQGKAEKFKRFRAYLKDSSKFAFTLPEPRAWPDGKPDGESVIVPAAVGGAPKKVPPIMRLVFDRGGASKAQLKSRLNILATTRHCLSCDQIVQKMEGGFWKLVADEHENATKHKGQWTFPICKL